MPGFLLTRRAFPFARIAAGVAIVVALTGAGSAGAEPSAGIKRAQADEILRQIERLDEEVNVAAERWNGANLRLQSLTRELRSTRHLLQGARRDHRVAQRRLSTRLVQLYTSDQSHSTLAVMLGATSLGEALEVIDTRDRIARQDRRIARQVEAARESAAHRERRIDAARAEQASTVQRLESERAAIASRLSDRQRLLASVQSEVRRLEAQERARQVVLRARAQSELERQQRALREARSRERPVPAAEPAPLQADPPATETEPAPTPPPAVAAPPADAGRGAQVVAIALRYLGIPYRWGGASPSGGFDCSGLTMYVFAQIGVSLPHYAAAQYGMGVPVSASELQAGDLVFFHGLGHMGMYIGGGNFVHAPHTGDVVKVSPLAGHYMSRLVGARRVL